MLRHSHEDIEQLGCTSLCSWKLHFDLELLRL
jgi:hypothetical protein